MSGVIGAGAYIQVGELDPRIDCPIVPGVDILENRPAVPIEPKTIAGIANFISACWDTIIALFPPSSRIVLPRRFETSSDTRLPTRVEPVIEIKGIRLSSRKLSPRTEDFAMTRLKTPSGTLFSLSTFLIIFWVAIAVKGVFELGFHMTTSPHTAAIMAFHAHTATGKLNADTTPTIPRG